MFVLLGSGFGMFLNIFRGFGIDFWWQAVILRSKDLLQEDASNAKRACTSGYFLVHTSLHKTIIYFNPSIAWNLLFNE